MIARGPCRSSQTPTSGADSPDTSRASEYAPVNVEEDQPSSFRIGVRKIEKA